MRRKKKSLHRKDENIEKNIFAFCELTRLLDYISIPKVLTPEIWPTKKKKPQNDERLKDWHSETMKY